MAKLQLKEPIDGVFYNGENIEEVQELLNDQSAFIDNSQNLIFQNTIIEKNSLLVPTGGYPLIFNQQTYNLFEEIK